MIEVFKHFPSKQPRQNFYTDGIYNLFDEIYKNKDKNTKQYQPDGESSAMGFLQRWYKVLGKNLDHIKYSSEQLLKLIDIDYMDEKYLDRWFVCFKTPVYNPDWSVTEKRKALKQVLYLHSKKGLSTSLKILLELVTNWTIVIEKPYELIWRLGIHKLPDLDDSSLVADIYTIDDTVPHFYNDEGDYKRGNIKIHLYTSADVDYDKKLNLIIPIIEKWISIKTEYYEIIKED